jgi:hypothetical protein
MACVVLNNGENSAGEILPSKKYGVDLPRFTHHSDSVIVAPSLGTDSVQSSFIHQLHSYNHDNTI